MFLYAFLISRRINGKSLAIVDDAKPPMISLPRILPTAFAEVRSSFAHTFKRRALEVSFALIESLDFISSSLACNASVSFSFRYALDPHRQWHALAVKYQIHVLFITFHLNLAQLYK